MPARAQAQPDDPFETMRQSFREESEERLGDMDKLIQKVLDGAAPLEPALRQLRRDTHTLKGIGEASGFPLVSMVAYRLENYIDDLDAAIAAELALADIRAHIDAMQDAIAGKSPNDEPGMAAALRRLPIPRIFNPGDIELRNVEALLVTSSRVVGRLVARELAACGIRAVLTDLARALTAMATTHNVPVAILTSFSESELAKQGLPRGIPTIRTEHLSDDLAAVITSHGIG